jgi:hypothetical protein
MSVRATLIRWFESLFRHDLTAPLEKIHNPRYYGRRMQLCSAAVAQREALKERFGSEILKPACTASAERPASTPAKEVCHNPRYYGRRLRRVS